MKLDDFEHSCVVPKTERSERRQNCTELEPTFQLTHYLLDLPFQCPHPTPATILLLLLRSQAHPQALSSKHVPKFGMLVAQIGNLLWCSVLEPVVSFASRSKPVFAPVPEDAERRQAQHDELHAQIDAVADVVVGGVVD